ncbi:phage protein GemA/Gp16 family protein [Ruegeria atlantica]|uniref:phage protein GemA/Gp16 family protein n=1 Tax=Ruegeria atlantica TaxID=81569 RepID=UPI0020C4C88C|nr:phage protein GemA/Gp16 family protein [Ruegeria atlantica]
MTRAVADSERLRLMRAVFAACKRLGLETEARHDVQLRVTGHASLRDMNSKDIARLLKHLDRLTGPDRRRGQRGHALAPRGDLRLIHALWTELGRRGALTRPGRAGLNAFIRSRFEGHWAYVPIDVDALSDPACINDVIRALKAMMARSEEETGGQTG